MTDIKIYKKKLSRIIALALTVNEILTFEIFDMGKVGQSHRLQPFSMRPRYGKYLNL